MRISLDTRIKSLEVYLRCNLSFTRFKEEWQKAYGPDGHPNRKYMYKLVQKFRRYGSLTNQKRIPNRPVRNTNTITDVAAYYNVNKTMSLRSFFRDESLNISKSTLRTILKFDLGLKSYKSRKFHRLHGHDDYLQRYNMCKFLMDKVDKDATFFSKVIWTDECYFKLNDVENTYNIGKRRVMLPF